MRRLPLVVTLASALLLAPGGRAHAAGMWLSTNGFSPNELRVAIAAGPTRTTVWTSLAFDSWPTTVGLVLPVPSGTMVDVAPDAWFEALDTAMAPRIYADPNLTCPDGSPPANSDNSCAGIAAWASPQPTIPAVSFDLLETPDAVTAWANDHDMAIPTSVAPALAALTASRFVAVRFIAPPPGGGVTQTIRVVMPGAVPKLALSLFDTSERAPYVTTYLIGPGEGALAGTTPVFVDASQLIPYGCYTNNYFDAISSLLDAPGTALLQSAGHQLWTSPAGTDPGSHFDSVLDAYFQGAPEGANPPDVYTCLDEATAALASYATVEQACPVAQHGVVDGGPACVEGSVPSSPAPAAVLDPTSLRCGAADDVAIALSGLVPANAWVTRESMYLSRSVANVDYAVTFASGQPEIAPIVIASALDPNACPTTGTGGGTTAAPASSSGCDGGAAADATAEGCGAAADGLSGLGDLGDCSVGRARPRSWALFMALAAIAAPMRRMRRLRRRRK